MSYVMNGSQSCYVLRSRRGPGLTLQCWKGLCDGLLSMTILVKTVVEPMVSKIFHSSGMALFLKSEFTSTFRVNSIQIIVAWWVGLHIISYLWINWMDSLFLHCVALNLIVPCEGPILIWNISSNSRVSCHQVISLPSCSCQYYVISMITLVSSMYALLVSNSLQHA